MPPRKEASHQGWKSLITQGMRTSAPGIKLWLQAGTFQPDSQQTHHVRHQGTQASQVAAPQQTTRGRQGEGPTGGSFPGPPHCLIQTSSRGLRARSPARRPCRGPPQRAMPSPLPCELISRPPVAMTFILCMLSVSLGCGGRAGTQELKRKTRESPRTPSTHSPSCPTPAVP